MAAGSWTLAGCALACALFMELAEYSRCVASDLLSEVCLLCRKSFPGMTVFDSTLRIAKWRATPQGTAGNYGRAPRLLEQRKVTGVRRVHATAEPIESAAICGELTLRNFQCVQA